MELIRPKKTLYNDILFRSRLEARWAVFFDYLGIKHMYEPAWDEVDIRVGYIQYKPDFHLSDLDIWVEVKPLRPEKMKWGDLKKAEGWARSPSAKDSSNHFQLEHQGGVFEVAFDQCREAGLIPSNVMRCEYPPFRHAVLKVYHAALNMGLILPSRLDQALDWSAQSAPFHFTTEGIKYFSEGFISIDDPGHLGEALQDLKQRFPAIEDGQIELLLEAQRCIKAACYRAGMVVIGVANEDSCLALLDAIPLNCVAPADKSTLYNDWNNCCNQSLAFARRWKPGIRLLEALKSQLRSSGKGEPWWLWWEMIPGSLYTVGEAVRISRNLAAHNIERSFSKAEVALLLAAMPTQIEMIANISQFLKDPPSSVSQIQIP